MLDSNYPTSPKLSEEITWNLNLDIGRSRLTWIDLTGCIYIRVSINGGTPSL